MTTPYPIRCRIRNADDSGVTRIDVMDDIGDYGWSGGLSAQDFAAQMAGIQGDVECHINSGGGDVFDGVAIANAIRAHKGKVTTIVDGIAASIASVIMQAGQERIVEPGSMVMIHEAYGGCMGDAAEMAKQSEVLDKVSGNIADIYAGRAGGTPESWRAAMKEESWYKADEAVAAGLADKVGTGSAELPAGLDLAAYAFPSGIAASLRRLPVAPAPVKPKGAADSKPKDGDQSCADLGHQCCKDAAEASVQISISGGGSGQALTDALLDQLRRLKGAQDKLQQIGSAQGKPGTHGDHERWDPDGNGDCDACPEGDTDHSHWSESGEQLQSVPGSPMPDDDGDMEDRLSPGEIRAFRQMLADLLNAADVDNSDWDASKAWSAGADSDDPAAFYAGICAGKKAGDKSTQAAWALPYKYAPSSPVNAAGVKAALSRLPQTEGLTNEAEAKATLQAAMKKVNPDYEPAGDHSQADLSGPGLEQFRSALEGATR
jgi:ATP-dependent Clp endopeptidase proteolytic subunit ClpP